jgi:hypothetical protein
MITARDLLKAVVAAAAASDECVRLVVLKGPLCLPLGPLHCCLAFALTKTFIRFPL